MIKTVFLFANGLTACTDEQGQQVPEEQGVVYHMYLLDKIKRGVIDRNTEIRMQLPFHDGQGGTQCTLADLLFEEAFFFPEYLACCELLGILPRPEL